MSLRNPLSLSPLVRACVRHPLDVLAHGRVRLEALEQEGVLLEDLREVVRQQGGHLGVHSGLERHAALLRGAEELEFA